MWNALRFSQNIIAKVSKKKIAFVFCNFFPD